MLKLDTWQEWFGKTDSRVYRSEIDYYTEIEPVFNRDGRYLKDGFSWFETNGKAYVSKSTQSNDTDSFKYSLKLLNVPNLTKKSIDALKYLQNEKLTSKTQNALLYDLKVLKDIRQSLWSVKKHSMVRRRRMAEFEKQNSNYYKAKL